MTNELDVRSGTTTTEGRLSRPIGEATGLAKQGANSPVSTPKAVESAPGGDGASSDIQTSVVQFSLLFDGDTEKFAHLWAMRDVMHRVLNTAISEWHRADKVASRNTKEDGTAKETLDRGAVTAAVKALLDREKSYWAEQLPRKTAVVEKARVALGCAKTKGMGLAEAERALEGALNDVARVRVKAEIGVPSSVYDSAVRYTQARLAIYRKEAFRGLRSLDSYRAGQPIRWRDGSWTLEEGERRGQYVLGLQISSDGKRVERGAFTVIPDGPSMHGFAKKMVGVEAIARGDVKLCDARVVYSEKKKQWFAKLTIRYKREAVRATGSGTAALRRGVHNAFVMVFENGRAEMITGGDVLHFKRKLKARKVSIGRHKDRLELGTGARGRGKQRPERALRKIHDAEDRFVDWRCKTWAANIAQMCRDRHVGRLLLPKVGQAEMYDGNEYVRALLHQWPFARMLDHVQQAVEKVGVVVKEYMPHYDARRCPNLVGGKRCGHVHDKPPIATVHEARHTIRYAEGTGGRQAEKVVDTIGAKWTCEVCGFERPADQVVAWNGLIDAVGTEPMAKAKEAKAERAALAAGMKKKGRIG
jgi:hypothetical protein